MEHGEKASVAGYNAMGDTDTPAAPVPEPQVPIVPEMSHLDLQDDATPQHRMYPERHRQPPTEWYRNTAARLHSLEGLTDHPATYQEAMLRPDWEQFDQAIAAELASLGEKGVYTEESPLPGVTHLPAKLLLDIKRDEKKFIEKYKARIVAQGFRQLAGRDYDDVFAPTAQHVTPRVLIAVASSLHLEVDQLDVKTAFLNGDVSEEIYIKLPPELGSKVWSLHKALYGLKRQPAHGLQSCAVRCWSMVLHPPSMNPASSSEALLRTKCASWCTCMIRLLSVRAPRWMPRKLISPQCLMIMV